MKSNPNPTFYHLPKHVYEFTNDIKELKPANFKKTC